MCVCVSVCMCVCVCGVCVCLHVQVVGIGVYACECGYFMALTIVFLLLHSWGTNWGLYGYIMMSRNRYNQCGIASDASYPTL